MKNLKNNYAWAGLVRSADGEPLVVLDFRGECHCDVMDQMACWLLWVMSEEPRAASVSLTRVSPPVPAGVLKVSRPRFGEVPASRS